MEFPEEIVQAVVLALPVDPSDQTHVIGYGDAGEPLWGDPNDVARAVLAALAPAMSARLRHLAAWNNPTGLADPAELSCCDRAISDAFNEEASVWDRHSHAVAG